MSINRFDVHAFQAAQITFNLVVTFYRIPELSHIDIG
jgi:hypothetical protein